jgi:hypothetical protein
VALAKVPSGPNAREITARVRELLAEGRIPETAIPAAFDLLGLFVTAAARDRVPAASSTPQQHHDLLRWEIEVILNGLATTAPPDPAHPVTRGQGHTTSQEANAAGWPIAIGVIEGACRHLIGDRPDIGGAR